MNQRQFTYKKQSPGIDSAQLLGICLIACGIIVLLFPFFFEVNTNSLKIGIVGGGAVLIGFLLLSIHSGVIINFQTRKFKEYQSFLWFKMGEWVELPKIEGVELIHHSYKSVNTPNGISPTLSSNTTVYKCVLIANGTKFLAFDFNKEKDAIEAMKEIGDGLGI
ncbi:hypothetical protein [Algoriphagus sp.]|uniref:hypothetical protein n=1 Tax=Algoriphagus sp. TaxID=1872435 RepID=UPI0025D22503|nr:hypothetical protein [Algoriphagus sp.]